MHLCIGAYDRTTVKLIRYSGIFNIFLYLELLYNGTVLISGISSRTKKHITDYETFCVLENIII